MGIDIGSVLIFGWEISYKQYQQMVQYDLRQKGRDIDSEEDVDEEDLFYPKFSLDLFGIKGLEFKINSVAYYDNCPFYSKTFYLAIQKGYFTVEELQILLSYKSSPQYPILVDICQLLHIESEPQMVSLPDVW